MKEKKTNLINVFRDGYEMFAQEEVERKKEDLV
jgi:hypothetical protein